MSADSSCAHHGISEVIPDVITMRTVARRSGLAPCYHAWFLFTALQVQVNSVGFRDTSDAVRSCSGFPPACQVGSSGDTGSVHADCICWPSTVKSTFICFRFVYRRLDSARAHHLSELAPKLPCTRRNARRHANAAPLPTAALLMLHCSPAIP